MLKRNPLLLMKASKQESPTCIRTIQEIQDFERQNILLALEQSGWKVSGETWGRQTAGHQLFNPRLPHESPGHYSREIISAPNFYPIFSILSRSLSEFLQFRGFCLICEFSQIRLMKFRNSANFMSEFLPSIFQFIVFIYFY